jgi:tRNA pseudouridine55 synthase
MKSRIIAIHKPKGPTSHDVVNQIRKITGEKRVGHAGTLDPLASGVLVVGIGREATKQLGTIVEKEKEYVATIKFGETSTTDDEEGEKTKISNTPTSLKLRGIHAAVFPILSKTASGQIPNNTKIQNSINKFIGTIEQIPPKYSAIKINGKEAYKYARKGKEVEMKVRNVVIHSINVESYVYPFLVIRVICGPGVYIRSLARDIGEVLGTGAYLADLIRTRVGKYVIADALTIDNFKIYYANNLISSSKIVL